MDSPRDTYSASRSTDNPRLVPAPAVPEVTAEALDREPVIIPPERHISWLGWITALAFFAINRKLGLTLVIVLLVFKQWPTLNLRNIPRKAGRLYKKLRS